MELRSTCHRRTRGLALLSISISLCVFAPVKAATIIYAIDPARSQLVGSGNVRNIPMSPQAPGSLAGQVNGWLSAQWHDDGLAFSGGSRIVAMPHPAGPFLPSPQDTGSGSMVDNFGAEGRLLGARLFSAAVRDAVADIVSGAANFGGPATDLQFGFVDGAVDYHDGFNEEFGFFNLAELLPVPNSSGGNLVRTVENNLDTITVPVFVDFPIEFLEPNDSRLRIEGQIVATSPVLTIEAGTLTTISSNLHLTALVVEPDANVRLAGAPLVAQTLRMSDDAGAGATLDLANVNTAMIVDYLPGVPTPATDIRERILAGRGNTDLVGAWDGKGITSSAAQADPAALSVGWALNGDLPLGPYQVFRGEIVDPTSILIRATRSGDVNLNGVVDDADVTIVGATYGTTAGAVWALGDFDYDGDVDDSDVTLISALYDPGAPPLGALFGTPQDLSITAVPEPASGALAALVGFLVGLIGWRRGRRWHR